MAKSGEVGKDGEQLAVQYLVKNGYEILETNFWRPWGELDIVAKDRLGILVFFEVKTLKDYPDRFLNPEDNFNKNKIEKFKRTASFYAGIHDELIKESLGWRLDLITIVLRSNELTDKSNSFVVRHWENI